MALTKASPLSKLLAIGHLDQRDLVLRAQRHNELLVRLLLARLIEDAHMRLASIERLARLTEPTRKPVVDERELEHALERLQHAHLALACGCIGAHFDFACLGDCCGWNLFSVRLCLSSVQFLRNPYVQTARAGEER